LSWKGIFPFRLWSIHTLFSRHPLFTCTIQESSLHVILRRFINFRNQFFIRLLMINVVDLIDQIFLPEFRLIFACTVILNVWHLERWMLLLPMRIEHCIFNFYFYVCVVNEFILVFLLSLSRISGVSISFSRFLNFLFPSFSKKFLQIQSSWHVSLFCFFIPIL